MQNKQPVKVQDAELNISLSKSKRLAAMRQSVEMGRRVQSTAKMQAMNGDKKSDDIKQARAVIEQCIVNIKANYPQGMQNKMFALRYASEDEIAQMSLQQLYRLFNIQLRLAKEILQVKFRG